MASLLGRRSDNIDEDNASDGHGSTITTPVIQRRLVLSEHLFCFSSPNVLVIL